MANILEHRQRQTYEYAKAILDLATREVHQKGKVLIMAVELRTYRCEEDI